MTPYNPHHVTYLEDDPGHELRVRLLIGQELANHFVHDVLRRKEVGEEGRKHPSDDLGLVRKPLPDPAMNKM